MIVIKIVAISSTTLSVMMWVFNALHSNPLITESFRSLKTLAMELMDK